MERNTCNCNNNIHCTGGQLCPPQPAQQLLLPPVHPRGLLRQLPHPLRGHRVCLLPAEVRDKNAAQTRYPRLRGVCLSCFYSFFLPGFLLGFALAQPAFFTGFWAVGRETAWRPSGLPWAGLPPWGPLAYLPFWPGLAFWSGFPGLPYLPLWPDFWPDGDH